MDKTALLQKLNTIERLAQGTKSARFLNNPWRYLNVILYAKILYPFLGKTSTRTPKTFFNTAINIQLPAGSDLYLLGTKTHDSEIRLTRYLILSLKPGDNFIDVGAHFGFFSLLAAQLVKEHGNVFAFEASPKTFAFLKKSTAINENIKPQNCIVGDTLGNALIYEFPMPYSEFNTILPQQFDRTSWRKKISPKEIEVPAIRLDQFIQQKELSQVFIKIDVEGGELNVLKGLKESLEANTPLQIAMEYLSPSRENQPHQEALNYLRGYKFRPHIINVNGKLEACDDPNAYLEQKQLDSENIVFTKSI